MKEFASFRLDTANGCLWRHGVQIALPPRPFAVLRYLVENPGRLITHDELLDAVWPETYVQPQVLRTYMRELRKILGDDLDQPRFIQTLPKRGYCFLAPVTEWDGKETMAAPGRTAREMRTSGIVGRSDEMQRLEDELQRVAGGQRRVVFVTGETGIGKTALVDAFCRQMAPAQGGIVARGQCVEGFGGKEEYYPVIEALGQLCAGPDGEQACRILARMAPVWLSALGRGEGTAIAGASRSAGDLCAALEELSVTQPLILVFEDLHWSDEATLHLISALARRRAPARLMVLATCGREDTVAEHALKALRQDLLIRQLCTVMALTPLSRAAVRDLLMRDLDQEALPAGLTSFVHQKSEGNPLFVIAMREHLVARQFLVREGAKAGWGIRGSFEEMEASVPDGLAPMIELEMERLRPDERRLLEAGSLMGIAFPVWAVAAALEEDAAGVEEACDDLARRLHFLEHGGEDVLPDGRPSDFYVFVHGLYREVLYQRQPATRRANRHIRIGDRLGELFAGREASVAREMAAHYEKAGAWQRAFNALRAAALHAEQRQAFAEAAELREHAEELSLRHADALMDDLDWNELTWPVDERRKA